MDLNAICGEDIDIRIRYSSNDKEFEISSPESDYTSHFISTYGEILEEIKDFIEAMYYCEM